MARIIPTGFMDSVRHAVARDNLSQATTQRVAENSGLSFALPRMPAFSRPWPDDFAPQASPARRGLRFALILAAHVGLIWAVMELATRPEVREIASDLMVRLIEPEPKKELPPPTPPKAPQRAVKPPPIMTAAPETPAPSASFAVAPQPPAPAVIEAAPAPAPAVVGARFDADYLSNPKPVYPTASRRLGEEGKVLLRVRVSAAGAPLAVEVKQSSGFARLDEAAKAAVEQWRFVPAKRGSEAIESWVAVPVVFSLQSS